MAVTVKKQVEARYSNRTITVTAPLQEMDCVLSLLSSLHLAFANKTVNVNESEIWIEIRNGYENEISISPFQGFQSETCCGS